MFPDAGQTGHPQEDSETITDETNEQKNQAVHNVQIRGSTCDVSRFYSHSFFSSISIHPICAAGFHGYN